MEIQVCPHQMKDEALIQLPGKSSRYYISKGLLVEKKEGKTVALKAVSFKLQVKLLCTVLSKFLLNLFLNKTIC